jgi:transposase InsO family protein
MSPRKGALRRTGCWAKNELRGHLLRVSAHFPQRPVSALTDTSGERTREAAQHAACPRNWGHSNDHSRLAYCELLPRERREDCAAFLRRAVSWYAEQGITVERVLSDNAKAYHSHLWQETCAELGIARRYTRPYSPWTNGKAEALIKTLLREWCYRFAFPSSAHRARALAGYLRWYNRRRPHGSLGARPPISRVSHVRGQYS